MQTCDFYCFTFLIDDESINVSMAIRLNESLVLTQLCRFSEDLAAVPDAHGRRPNSGPGPQPPVTWGTGCGHGGAPAGRVCDLFNNEGTPRRVEPNHQGYEAFSPPGGCFNGKVHLVCGSCDWR